MGPRVPAVRAIKAPARLLLSHFASRTSARVVAAAGRKSRGQAVRCRAGSCRDHRSKEQTQRPCGGGTNSNINMENKWFMDIIFDEFRSGKINIDKTLKLLNKFEVSYDYVHVKKVFKKNDKQKSGLITMEDFRAIYRTLLHRPEFSELFGTYSANKKTLTPANLAEFLKKEQFELDANEGRAVSLINKFEPIDEGTLKL